MGINWPTSLDTNATLKNDVLGTQTLKQINHAELHNNVSSAIRALQGYIGTDTGMPAADKTLIRRVSALETKVNTTFANDITAKNITGTESVYAQKVLHCSLTATFSDPVSNVNWVQVASKKAGYTGIQFHSTDGAPSTLRWAVGRGGGTNTENSTTATSRVGSDLSVWSYDNAGANGRRVITMDRNSGYTYFFFDNVVLAPAADNGGASTNDGAHTYYYGGDGSTASTNRRWAIGKRSSSGANDFAVWRYAAVAGGGKQPGDLLDNPILINSATGKVTFSQVTGTHLSAMVRTEEVDGESRIDLVGTVLDLVDKVQALVGMIASATSLDDLKAQVTSL